MTGDPQKNNTASDDMDVIALIGRVMLFFERYKWIYIAAVILGISSGIAAYSILPNVYTSSAVIHSYYLTNQEQIQITENWSRLLNKKEYTELATSLDCSESSLRKLKKIDAEEIQKVFTGVNPHGFVITVDVSENSILDELQAGIIYGFENNIYVKQRLEARKDNLAILIKETNNEIQKLDSTKKIMESILSGQSKTSSLIIDIAGPNRQLVEMNEKLLAYKDELRFTNAVQVLQGFSKFRRPTNPKLIPWLAIGLMLFLSLAFVYTLYRSIKEKLVNHSANADQ